MTALRTHLFFAWLLLFWLDGVLTYVALQWYSAMEMNVVLVALAQFGLLPAIVFLKAIGSLCTLTILAHLRAKLAILPLAASVGAYVAIVIWNIGVLL
jgi:hypothetical protein